MLYTEALDYLYNLTNYERVSHLPGYSPETLKLDRVRELLTALGNPHERYKTIHIAGTKGKGSTSAMLESCLRHLGLKTGLYTSPHLTTFRERIRVNNELIAPEVVGILTEQIKAAIEHIPGTTYFEAVTVMALLHFSREDVEWAVIETGLGGRLDATNVIASQASVITSISYDHQQWLGHTLAEIAGEKCGIIKEGVPVVSHSQMPEASKVIESVAHERNAPLTMIGRHWRWTAGQTSLIKQDFEIKQVSLIRSKEKPFVNDLEGRYEIALLGKHQVENASSVIATLDVLRESLQASGAKKIDTKAIREGLWNARWSGRFEILRADPPVIIDGAHNVDSVNKLAMTLAEVFPGKRWTLIFGTMTDKDAEGMIRALNPRAGRWIFTQSGNNPRAVSAENLLETAKRNNARNVSALPNVMDAVDFAYNTNDAVCVTGSIVLIGEVKTKWALRTGSAFPPTDRI
jgi:dihydrofolate synthase/folylpolyglutamate synthase